VGFYASHRGGKLGSWAVLAWVAVVLCLACPAFAAPASVGPWTPRSLAEAVEAQVAVTSWQDLEQFGQDSLKLPVDERLRRLEYITGEYVWGTDMARFEKWNRLLRREAQAAHSRRYLVAADLNDLAARYMKGDVSVMARFDAVAKSDPDWFLRAYAMNSQAFHQNRETRIAQSLRTLSMAEALIPGDSTDARIARARLSSTRGGALMRVEDPQQSTQAFGHARFELLPPSYPNPDFSDIYSLGLMATRIGDWDLAAEMSQRHHRLTVRSQAAGVDLPVTWDKYLCALVAEHKTPRDVLQCVRDLDLYSEGSDARHLAPRLLPIRGIAYAKLGEVAAARRDYEALRKLRASGAFPAASFEREPMVEAALLRAEGHDAEAYDRLLAYSQARAQSDAQKVRAGMNEVAEEMQQSLEAHRRQLESAQHNVALQQDVIAAKSRLNRLAIVVVAAILGLLLWQGRIMRQLGAARKAADKASQFKSQFLANMSHEIRTPLNGVVAGADLLATLDLAPQAQELADIIQDSSVSLQRLISDILDVTRIEEGKLALEAAPFQIAEVARSVSNLFKPRCEQKGLTFQTTVRPEADFLTLGDGLRVRQIVTNLVSNAVKFTETGRVRLEVELRPQGLVRFLVTDTGIGFDPADKAKVLGRFEQADASITRRFGGSGLGLSICRDLAELMGGSLDCESTPGQGSRFWVDLPLEPVEATSVEPIVRTQPLPAGLRVLLADDHPVNRKLVEAILGDAVALSLAEDGGQAVELFQSQAFDLVLMDMQMPVMDGLSATREIRRLERAANGGARIPLVLLSANALPEHVSASLSAGADLHLAKPFTAASLRTAMADALSMAEDRPAANRA
jgi:signal transduction histidine kinase/ActR/RegA family two-component response regulator